MGIILANEFINQESNKNARLIGDNQLASLVNMDYVDNGAIMVRKGITLFKNNIQWGELAIIDGVSFKRATDDFYFIVVVLEDGRLFYIKSNNANFGNPTATWTEILSPAGASPALSASLGIVSLGSLNNILFLADGTDRFYYWDGISANLSKVNDPVNSLFTFTILNTVNASIDAVYKDTEDATREFVVGIPKVSGDGVTTLSVYQRAGQTRPSVGGTDTLTKLSGTGDATIAYTGVTFTEKFFSVIPATHRLWAIGDQGKAHFSVANNGRDFISPDASFEEYDRIEGLKVSKFIAFSEGAILVTEDPVTQRFQTSVLTGYKPFDPDTPGTEVGQFKIQRLNAISGIVGRSAQEIGGSVIGLTPSGFISLQAALSGGGEFGLTSQSFLSDPIGDIIENINFSKVDTIVSTVDYVNGRYLVAVPLGVASFPSTVLVYDFRQSTPETQKWTIYNFNLGPTNYIRALFSVLNVPFVCDNKGNVYKTNQETYLDNGNVYNWSLTTKAFGGETFLSEKRFKEAWLMFITPTKDTQNITVSVKADGKIVTEHPNGYPFPQLEVTPEASGLKWDTPGLFWDFGATWDSGAVAEQAIRTALDIRATNLQLTLLSDPSGGQWGLAGACLTYEDLTASKGGKKETL